MGSAIVSSRVSPFSQSIFALNPRQWEDALITMGEKKYRSKQIRQWIYQKLVDGFDQMSDLPLELRQRLAEKFTFQNLKLIEHKKSQLDKSEKFLWQMHLSGRIVFFESVLIFSNDRATSCLSSQVGCRVACTFCKTADVKPVYHLPAWAILEQHWQMLKISGLEKIDNVVYMGMGEPIHNYRAVIESAYRLTEHPGFFLHPKRITISTSGVLPGMERYLREGHPFRLALSLNASRSETREKLIPHEKTWPIEKLIGYAERFFQRHKKRVTFEYVLMAGVNDSAEDGRRLGKIFVKVPAKVNIIPFNENEKGFYPPTEEQIDIFIQAYLAEIDKSRKGKHKSAITLRRSAGSDIGGACGQLAGKKS